MKHTISVTEAARNFADIVSRVFYRGERFVLERGGRPRGSTGPGSPRRTARRSSGPPRGCSPPVCRRGGGVASGYAGGQGLASRPPRRRSVGVLIDTSVLIDYERGRVDLEARIRGREEETFFLSVVTASELLHGVHRAKDPVTPRPEDRLRRGSSREHALPSRRDRHRPGARPPLGGSGRRGPAHRCPRSLARRGVSHPRPPAWRRRTSGSSGGCPPWRWRIGPHGLRAELRKKGPEWSPSLVPCRGWQGRRSMGRIPREPEGG